MKTGPAPKNEVVGAAEVLRAAPFAHVYVHVPFCVRKCPYCDFNSHAGRDHEMDAYLDALEAEAHSFAPHLQASTVFVGGGTPTHLPAKKLERLLAIVRSLCSKDVRELTVEANPGSLDLEKVRVLKDGGVDRVSLGVQSFDDRHLATLGRAHDAADAVRSLEVLARGNLQRLSLDLMMAIPGQTLGDQARDLARAVDCAPEHVSAYVLTFEPGTAFTKMRDEGRLPNPDADRELEHLHMAGEVFARAGLARYEVSNFSRPDTPCEHNMAYWDNADWVGIGAGAHSHANGVRWKNVDDPAGYARAIREGLHPLAWSERIDAPGRLAESLLMGLRLDRGVDMDRAMHRTGVDVRVACAQPLHALCEEGLLVIDGAYVRTTTTGMDVLDAVLLRLTDPILSDARALGA